MTKPEYNYAGTAVDNDELDSTCSECGGAVEWLGNPITHARCLNTNCSILLKLCTSKPLS